MLMMRLVISDDDDDDDDDEMMMMMMMMICAYVSGWGKAQPEGLWLDLFGWLWSAE